MRRKQMMMTCKDGEYYYAPHRRKWGVWQWQELGGGFGAGSFVGDFNTKEEAEREVYRLNGWNNK